MAGVKDVFGGGESVTKHGSIEREMVGAPYSGRRRRVPTHQCRRRWRVWRVACESLRRPLSLTWIIMALFPEMVTLRIEDVEYSLRHLELEVFVGGASNKAGLERAGEPGPSP